MLNADFDKIRSKLDKLNALSDSINSLERQFDEANSIFRETLKCSTDRLSSIARTIGSKSIRHGRVYHEAKITVEQNQSECQKACVQFEQANKDHQFAKKVILEAEQRIQEIAEANGRARTNGENKCSNLSQSNSSGSSLGLDKLKFTDETNNGEDSQIVPCDEDVVSTNSIQTMSTTTTISSSSFSSSISFSAPTDSPAGSKTTESTVMLNNTTTEKSSDTKTTNDMINAPSSDEDQAPESNQNDSAKEEDEVREEVATVLQDTHQAATDQIVSTAAKLSEQLNQAIMRLNEAEKRRNQSEKQHLQCANRLMIAKENLVRLEREHGQSIRRSQLYFDEAKLFNAKLDSVKGSICRISKDILSAKKAYAQTLSELEQFSEDLHESSAESAKEEVK